MAISHPQKGMLGRDMSVYKDESGLQILPAMWKILENEEEGFLTIWWKRLHEDEPVRKLLYFRFYPEWQWLIGTGVYIDDVAEDTQRMMDEIMNVLRHGFAQIDIAETGYYWLFNGDNEMLIHPSTATGMDQHHLAADRQQDLLDQLKKGASHPDKPIIYYWNHPEDEGSFKYEKYAYVDYFEPLDWYIVASIFKKEMELPARNIMRRQGVFVAIIVLVCIAVAYFLVTRVTLPLANLTRYARELQENDFHMPQERSRELLTITFPREIGNLSMTIWNMERTLREYLQNLTETTAARERMQSELRIAHDIQMSMLPAGIDPQERDDRVELYATLKPAKDVGGDLYDYFFLDKDHLCILLGDVSDKGVPASLFMARSKALLRTAATSTGAPEKTLEQVNHELIKGNDMCMFVTVFIGILDLTSGNIVFSNAAHCPPYITGARSVRKVKLPKGKPLGIDENAVYQQAQIKLHERETLIVFTDGITEAMNREKTLYSDQRLEKRLEVMQDITKVKAIVEYVIQGVSDFVQDAPQADDTTMLAVQYQPADGDRAG
jgi:sigma-B regulation protein RsbU (phosphoserine phosphatase)